MHFACGSIFPESLALVNPLAAQAYEMRFVEENIFRAECLITDSSGYDDFFGPREWSPRKPRTDVLLNPTSVSKTCDAILVVRPYVKFLGNTGDLEFAKLSFTMDGDPVIERDLVADYIVKDKYDKLKPVRPQCRDLFYACRLNEETDADASHVYGAMAVNATRLEVYLHRMDPGGEPVRIECGLVAATYTTDFVKK